MTQQWIGTLLFVLATSGFLGCASRRTAQDAAYSDRPDSIALVYQTGGQRLAVHRGRRGEDDFQHATLKMTYPHASGDPQLVNVLLELEYAGDDQFGAPVDARFEHAIPKWQLDQLLDRLNGEGYFEDGAPAGKNSYLRVQVHGTNHGRRYHAVPKLDALIVQMRAEGRGVRDGVFSLHRTF